MVWLGVEVLLGTSVGVGVLLGTRVGVGVGVQTSVKVAKGGKSIPPLEVGDGITRRKKKFTWVGVAVPVSHRVRVRLGVGDVNFIPVIGMTWLAANGVPVGITLFVRASRIRST